MKSVPPYVSLPLNFTELGFEFHQVARAGRFAVYHRHNKRLPKANDHWEVIRIQHEKARLFPSGRMYPDREVYPIPEDWGTHAWTCQSIERAMAKFTELGSCKG